MPALSVNIFVIKTTLAGFFERWDVTSLNSLEKNRLWAIATMMNGLAKAGFESKQEFVDAWKRDTKSTVLERFHEGEQRSETLLKTLQEMSAKIIATVKEPWVIKDVYYAFMPYLWQFPHGTPIVVPFRHPHEVTASIAARGIRGAFRTKVAGRAWKRIDREYPFPASKAFWCTMVEAILKLTSKHPMVLVSHAELGSADHSKWYRILCAGRVPKKVDCFDPNLYRKPTRSRKHKRRTNTGAVGLYFNTYIAFNTA